MTASACPDCLSPGIRNWWYVAGNNTVYVFLCSNLNCPRARDPWEVLESREPPRGSLLDAVVLGGIWVCVVVGGALREILSKLLSPLRRLLRYVLRRSNFSKPGMVLCHYRGRRVWVKESEYQEPTGEFEELREDDP